MSGYHDPVLRVLCVDDNQDIADTLVALMEIAGFQAKACYDGTTGIALAEQFRPDVCLLDLNMPGMPGDELGRRVRAGACGPGTVLVALTGLSEDEACRRSAAAGFDLYLIKPVDPEKLANTVIDMVLLRGPLTPTAPPLPPWRRSTDTTKT
jgi:two-component system OmpR family response regulator